MPIQKRHDIAQVIESSIAWIESGADLPINRLPAVVGAHRLIAGHIDQLPIVATNGVPRWLESPRRYGSPLDQGDLVQWLVGSMYFYGFAALAVTRVQGASWKLEPLNPQGVQCQATTGARLAMSWRVDGAPAEQLPAVHGQVVDGREYLLPIPYVVTPERPWGTTPLIDALSSLQGFTQTERAGANVFDTGTYSGGRLETDQDISPAVAVAYQKRWMENRRAGALPVLGSGLRYVNDLANASDLQLLEARAFNQAIVYSLFGIPLDMMGSALIGGQSSLSYQNAQDNNARYRANALAPFTTQIADGLSLLLPPGRDPDEAQRFDFDYAEWETATDADPSD